MMLYPTSSRDGYHPIQERITQYNGSQCGYCTPGMVMNMYRLDDDDIMRDHVIRILYSLLKESPSPTKQQIEDSFDGNICRCTGNYHITYSMVGKSVLDRFNESLSI